MSLPTNFNIVNRGELLAVINFPRQKTVEESFEFMEFLKSLFQGKLNGLSPKPTQKEEIEWLLEVLSYDGALTLSESAYSWLEARNYNNPSIPVVSSFDEAKEGVTHLAKGDTTGFVEFETQVGVSNFFYINKDYTFQLGIGYGMYYSYSDEKQVASDFDQDSIESLQDTKGYEIQSFPTIESLELSKMNMAKYHEVKHIIEQLDLTNEEVVKIGEKYYLFY